MRRDIEKQLLQWKDQKNRMPLLLRGARQVGKTYIIEKFGKENFEKLVVINFELQPEMIGCFESLDPIEIINAILLVKNEEERQIYVAAPPTILSVFPKGVSIASKATVPTTNTLISIFFANIFYYLMVCAIFTPVLKKHSSLAQLVRASDC